MRSTLTVLTLLVLLAGGCGSSPKPKTTEVAPQSTATPKATAKEIRDLTQSVTQLQTTVSKHTANYQLDAERAKVEEKRNRNVMKVSAAGAVMLMGLALLCLTAPAIAMGAISMMAGPGAILLLWPF